MSRTFKELGDALGKGDRGVPTTPIHQSEAGNDLAHVTHLQGQRSIVEVIAYVPHIPRLDGSDLIGVGGTNSTRHEKVIRRFELFLREIARSPTAIRPTIELRIVADRKSPAEAARLSVFIRATAINDGTNSPAATATQLSGILVNAFPTENPYGFPIRFLRAADSSDADLIGLARNAALAAGTATCQEVCLSLLLDPGDYSRSHLPPTRRLSPASVQVSPWPRVLNQLYGVHTYSLVSVSAVPTNWSTEDVRETRAHIELYQRRLKQFQNLPSRQLEKEAALRHAIDGLHERLAEFSINGGDLLAVKVRSAASGENPINLAALFGEFLPTRPRLIPEGPGSVAECLRSLREAHDSQVSESLTWRSRIESLYTCAQAAQLFHVPFPPMNGALTGLSVRDEPFVAPSSTAYDGSRPSISAGNIVHRGVVTSSQGRIYVDDLTRHVLIAGQTRTGKSTTVRYLLDQLSTAGIPFLIVYPLNRHDYRHLINVGSMRKTFQVFTIFSEVSPLYFNPLQVPSGFDIRSYIDSVCDTLANAYGFDPSTPVPLVLRGALKMAYQNKGHILDAEHPNRNVGFPTLVDLINEIPAFVDLTYPGTSRRTIEIREVVDNLLLLRLRDLVDRCRGALAVKTEFPIERLLDSATLLEVNGPGDDTIAAVMGLVLNRIRAEREVRKLPKSRPHVTVVEEAHRLMSRHSSNLVSGAGQRTADAFERMLAEIGGNGESVIVVEQMPSLLTKGAIGNTFTKISHKLDGEDKTTMAAALGLSESQARDFETLSQGDAITRAPDGTAIKTRSQRVIAASEPSEEYLFPDNNVRLFMERQIVRLGLTDRIATARQEAAAALIHAGQAQATPGAHKAPLGTQCRFCKPWLLKGQCPHKGAVERFVTAKAITVFAHGFEKGEVTLYSVDRQADWARRVIRKIASEDPTDPEVASCFVSHIAHQSLVPPSAITIARLDDLRLRLLAAASRSKDTHKTS